MNIDIPTPSPSARSSRPGRTRARFALVMARALGRRDRGQSTAEYALVMLGAATVALAFLGWATGSGRIESLFDQVIETVLGGM